MRLTSWTLKMSSIRRSTNSHPTFFPEAEVQKTDKAKTFWQRRAAADRQIHSGRVHLSHQDTKCLRFNWRIISDGKSPHCKGGTGTEHTCICFNRQSRPDFATRQSLVNQSRQCARQIGARLHVLQILHGDTHTVLRNFTCNKVEIYSGLTASGRMIKRIMYLLCLHIWNRTSLNGGNITKGRKTNWTETSRNRKEWKLVIEEVKRPLETTMPKMKKVFWLRKLPRVGGRDTQRPLSVTTYGPIVLTLLPGYGNLRFARVRVMCVSVMHDSHNK